MEWPKLLKCFLESIDLSKTIFFDQRLDVITKMSISLLTNKNEL